MLTSIMMVLLRTKVGRWKIRRKRLRKNLPHSIFHPIRRKTPLSFTHTGGGVIWEAIRRGTGEDTSKNAFVNFWGSRRKIGGKGRGRRVKPVLISWIVETTAPKINIFSYSSILRLLDPHCRLYNVGCWSGIWDVKEAAIRRRKGTIIDGSIFKLPFYS